MGVFTHCFIFIIMYTSVTFNIEKNSKNLGINLKLGGKFHVSKTLYFILLNRKKNDEMSLKVFNLYPSLFIFYIAVCTMSQNKIHMHLVIMVSHVQKESDDWRNFLASKLGTDAVTFFLKIKINMDFSGHLKNGF